MIYEVYIQINENGYIIAVNSSAFLVDTSDWVKIDEGYGDKYHHAQGNYFPQPIITMFGAYCYKLVDGAVVECSAEEIAEQEAALQPDPGGSSGTTAEELLAEMDAAYTEGVNSV